MSAAAAMDKTFADATRDARKMMAGDTDMQPQDMKAHVATYRTITSLFFWGAIGGAITALLVIWLIS